MSSPKKPEERSPIVPDVRSEIPMEELEERLEMQHVPAMDPSLACYTDLCPQHCESHCTAGYTGCTDLCSCDGSKCALACVELCMVESCLVDIV